MWNILYDDLLNILLPTGVILIAFTDAVAIVAKAPENYEMERLLSTSVTIVKNELSYV